MLIVVIDPTDDRQWDILVSFRVREDLGDPVLDFSVSFLVKGPLRGEPHWLDHDILDEWNYYYPYHH